MLYEKAWGAGVVKPASKRHANEVRADFYVSFSSLPVLGSAKLSWLEKTKKVRRACCF